MSPLPSLNAIRAFEAVARRLSFAAAAAELGVTVTAISHQIRHLEERLGLRLIDRGPRGVSLTAHGEAIFPMVREGFEKLTEAFAPLDPGHDGKAIRVTTTRAFAERWLLPRLDGFTADHPGLWVDIDSDEAVRDLASAGIDLAIRYAPRPSNRTDAVVLVEDRYVPVAPAGGPEVGEAWLDRPLLAFRWRNPALKGPSWRDWLRAAGRDDAGARFNMFSDEHLALQALDRGRGALLASDVLVADGFAAGRYVRLEGPSLSGFCWLLVTAPGARRRPAVRRFADWLTARLAADLPAPAQSS